MPRTLDDLDSRLLNLIQEEVPLVERPFAAIAEKLGTDEPEVLARMAAMKGGPHPIIRQISAIFDTKALGYKSSLVAARIAPERLAEAAEVINRHPGVSHNYQRNHAYNLWYTVAVPPRQPLRPGEDGGHPAQAERRPADAADADAEAVQDRREAEPHRRDRPTARSGPPKFTEEDRRQAMSFSVTDTDKRMIRVLAAGPADHRAALRRLGHRGAGERWISCSGGRQDLRTAEADAAIQRRAASSRSRLRGQRHGRLGRAARTAGGVRRRRPASSTPSATAICGRPTRIGRTTCSPWCTPQEEGLRRGPGSHQPGHRRDGLRGPVLHEGVQEDAREVLRRRHRGVGRSRRSGSCRDRDGKALRGWVYSGA